MSFGSTPPPYPRPPMFMGPRFGYRGGRPWGGRGWGGRGRGGMAGPGAEAYWPPPFVPGEVMSWLDCQPPPVLQQIYYHCRWLMDQYGIVTEDDANDQDEGDETEEQPADTENDNAIQDAAPKDNSEGLFDEEAIKRVEERQDQSQVLEPATKKRKGGPLHWTAGGWVAKDNSHKVTTRMKPLPPRDIIPPPSNTYPDVMADREKINMLRSNVSMMQFEVNKICRQYRIPEVKPDTDLSGLPEDQQTRLRTAVGCVANAEKTLKEFVDFLKEEKYKEWNDQQQKEHDEAVKAMIGEAPSEGTPHKKSDAEQETMTETEAS